MRGSRRLGLLSLVPLAGFAALFTLTFLVTATVESYDGDSLPATIPIAFGAIAALLIGAICVYVGFIVHIARRRDSIPPTTAFLRRNPI